MTNRVWGVHRTSFFAVGCALTFTSIYGLGAWAEAPGETTYKKLCVACHTIGGGRLVGPDLDGVSERRSEEWLVDFITSSQGMVQAGDADAVALVEEYNGLVMPDAMVPREEVLAIVAYLRSQTPAADAEIPAPSLAPAPAPAQTSQIEPQPATETSLIGGDLFQGTVRFANGGPTCIACHDITHEGVVGGGSLAAELTEVRSRMPAAGVEAILKNPPFPVMRAAYAEHPLTEGEVQALVTFMISVDPTHEPGGYGLALLGGGVAGTAVVYGLCGLIWRDRKKSSVNQDMFDRQAKTS